MPRQTKVHTRDGYDLSDLLMEGIQTFEIYNDEVERPFRDLFTHEVADGSFQTNGRGDMPWDEIGEGEHLGTGTLDDPFEMYMTVDEFGRALSWDRQYVEKNGREKLVKEFDALVKGYDKLERNTIQTAAMNAAADGSELWFDPEDHGEYSFSRTHDHTFGTTDELFYSDAYGTDATSGNAHTPTEHIRRANAHLRHHEKDPEIVLCSSLFKEQFVDEVSWEANYQFPEYDGLRTTDLEAADARVDGVTLVETPFINDHATADGTYEFHVLSGDKPVAFWPDAEPELVRNEKGAPITGPYQLFDAYGYARFGVKVTDPLSAVKVTADNLA